MWPFMLLVSSLIAVRSPAASGTELVAGEPVLPRVPVVMVLWERDEEYPARLSVLFDASIAQHLPLDAIYALVTVICRRMADR